MALRSEAGGDSKGVLGTENECLFPKQSHGMDTKEGLMNLLSLVSLQLTFDPLGTNSTLKLSHLSHQNP